ncbi:carboxylating nicotinate-nucleotide diphosphorylase [Schleiferiaceae bacterium]|nr:carboxylating nicotinate-nucleotide diphosphorylase [Schleiferiaceae bacterium]
MAEDIGDGDHSALSSIPADHRGKAQLIIKEAGVFAGGALATYLFKYLDNTATVEQFIEDGALVEKGTVALFVEGNTIKLLQSERLVLNYLQRLSGIATRTYSYAAKIKHTSCTVLDTRKTTPGLRLLEKWAVSLGGGGNHRMGLYDMVMLKDNHVDFAGGIKAAVARTKAYLAQTNRTLAIEVETRNLQEVKEALQAGVDRIMLDNFTVSATKEAVEYIAGRTEVESSGGITRHTLVPYAECGVDYISVGALTHHIKGLDMSLKAL